MAFPICRRGVSAEDGDDVAAGRTPLMLPQRKNAQIPLDRLRGGGTIEQVYVAASYGRPLT